MMGLRIGSAKLGFRLAAATLNKKIVSSKYTRRWTTSEATTTTTAIAQKEKTLYLFFEKWSRYKNGADRDLVIHPICLDTYDGDGQEEELGKIDTDHMFRVPTLIDTCIRLGSRILFALYQPNCRKHSNCPKDICWFDPSERPLKIHISSLTDTKIRSFSTRKEGLLWGVIDGKIYCLFNPFDEISPAPGLPFEVLDPEMNNPEWQPLICPPFISDYIESDNHGALFLNGSKKILGWEYENRGVYCFDTTKPENGWIESPPSLGNSIPFTAPYSMVLVIEEDHPLIGKFNLVFAYDRLNDPFVVYPIFISDNCDSYQNIDQLIRLPKELCSKYRVAYSDPCPKPYWRVSFHSEFVHLGDKKFCVVLHNFFANDLKDENTTKGVILVLTYEYDIIISRHDITKVSKAKLMIKTRLLGTRRFKYNLDYNSATDNTLLGVSFF